MAMNSLFLSFDPSTFFFSLNWSSLFFMIMLSSKTFWVLNSRLEKFSFSGYYVIHLELKSLSMNGKFGLTHFITSLWSMMLGVNLLGLLPYVFTSSSHLIFSFSFSMLIWSGPQLLFWIFHTNKALSHLVPENTPNFLIPLIIVIELISNFIRPLTLSIRLSANLMTGHLILTLLASSMFSEINFILLILPLVIMLSLEFCVALIQAQVFSMLSMIYSEESLTH